MNTATPTAPTRNPRSVVTSHLGTTRLFRHGAVEPGRARLLFLHGLGNGTGAWDQVVAGWPDQRDQLWLARLPWCGDGPQDWSYQQDAVTLAEDAVDLVPGGADVLVAHSFSASLVLEVLSRRGVGGLRGVVFVAPFYRRRPEDFLWDDAAQLAERFERTISDGIHAHARRPISGEFERYVAHRMCEHIGPYGWTRFFEIYLRSPWLRTDRITVPCLVLAGELDRSAGPAEGRALAEDLPDARARVLDEAGHFPMLERPGPFVTAVTDFVDQVWTPTHDQKVGDDQ